MNDDLWTWNLQGDQLGHIIPVSLLSHLFGVHRKRHLAQISGYLLTRNHGIPPKILRVRLCVLAVLNAMLRERRPGRPPLGLS